MHGNEIVCCIIHAALQGLVTLKLLAVKQMLMLKYKCKQNITSSASIVKKMTSCVSAF
jgi:hypothetical protein